MVRMQMIQMACLGLALYLIRYLRATFRMLHNLSHAALSLSYLDDLQATGSIVSLAVVRLFGWLSGRLDLPRLGRLDVHPYQVVISPHQASVVAFTYHLLCTQDSNAALNLNSEKDLTTNRIYPAQLLRVEEGALRSKPEAPRLTSASAAAQVRVALISRCK
ncbi:hypothetical protein F5X97DRAFT_188151 [Nemania serpens]|nr:hypothetical protein F5X97DRAFT_188151 [Nemania serpens]